MDEKSKIEMDISNVMFSLVPNASWSVKNGVLRWGDNSVTQPTEAEIQTEMIRLQAEYEAQEYARNRKSEYPDWGTQLEKIADDGIDAWKADMLEPVKAKFPKP